MEHLWLAFPTGQVPFEGRYFMVVTCLFIPPTPPTPAWQTVFQKLAASCVSVFLTRLGSEAAQHVQLEACPLWFGRIKFFQSRPFSRQLPGDLCPKGICLEPNRSRMDYKPAQTPKDYMMCLWLWNHLRPGTNLTKVASELTEESKTRIWAHSEMEAQGIPACRALSDTAETKQTKEPCYALCVNYALSVDYTAFAFHEENSGTCGVLTIFLSNLGKQNNELLGTEKKRGLHRWSGEPPIPHWMRKYLKRL